MRHNRMCRVGYFANKLLAFNENLFLSFSCFSFFDIWKWVHMSPHIHRFKLWRNTSEKRLGCAIHKHVTCDYARFFSWRYEIWKFNVWNEVRAKFSFDEEMIFNWTAAPESFNVIPIRYRQLALKTGNENNFTIIAFTRECWSFRLLTFLLCLPSNVRHIVLRMS